MDPCPSQARDTCATPYWTVDAAAQTYTVAVCDFAPGGAPSELPSEKTASVATPADSV